MQLRNPKDFWSGVMFIVVGTGFAWGSLNYSFGTHGRPGPAYFPFGLGILCAALGLVLLIKSQLAKADGEARIGAIAWRPLIAIVGSVVLFGVALPRLGLAISLPLVVVSSALAGDEFHLGEALANSLVLTLGSWAIFNWGLGLVIPLWPVFLAG